MQAQNSKINIENATSINFISGSHQHEQNFYKNTHVFIEKEKVEQETTLITPSKYGLGFTIMQKKGYDGYSGLGY